MPIRSVIVLLGISSLLGIPYTVLMPIFAGEILHGGPHTFGFLMTAAGFGALIGAVWLASRPSVVGLSRMIPVAAALFGCGLMGFASSRILPLSLLCLVVSGFGMMVQSASSNTVLQTIVPDDKRGRTMSFFLMAYLGAAPIGSLVAGALSGLIGAPLTLFIGGAACLGGAVWFASGLSEFHETIRPIYIDLGLITETQVAEAELAALSLLDGELLEDIRYLRKTWQRIKTLSQQMPAKSLLHQDLSLMQRVLRDLVSDATQSIHASR